MKLLSRRKLLRFLRAEARLYRQGHESGRLDQSGKARADVLDFVIGYVKRMRVRR